MRNETMRGHGRSWLTVFGPVGKLPHVQALSVMRSLAAVTILAALSPVALRSQSAVQGRLSVLDKGDKAAEDVGQAVVWLEGASAPVVTRGTAQMVTEGKQFVPRILVLAAGSTLTFPNNDPFNHNVFSLSEEGPFDLGLYGRGEAKGTTLNHPGIVRVYCNVHSTMSALVVVRDNTLWAQPGGDGSFRIEGVPPGRYVLHAWHERAGELTRDVYVGAEPYTVSLTLDARRYRFQAHLDKNGRPYSDRGRRY